MDTYIKDNIKGFLPNVEITGIQDIDKEYRPKEESSSGMMGLVNIGNLVGGN